MVRIESVRESNQRAKSLQGLVAVFVGGTNGIGETTARELFSKTTRPRAYILGRNEEKGNKLVSELIQSNPGSQAFYIKVDVALLKNVDNVCAELQRREKCINILFCTAGYMTLKGRTETPEGLDRKMCVNYYSRMRFAMNLEPQLTAASKAGQISRFMSVLAAGSEGDIRLEDLDLKHNYTLHACLGHCVMMTDFMMEEFSKRYPGTAWTHSYPGTVKTGIANELTGPEGSEAGLPIPDDLQVTNAMDGTPGGGAYLLDWDGRATGDENIIKKYRDVNLGAKTWEHLMDTFKRIVGPKRPAEAAPEGGNRDAPEMRNPTGWRSY
ncbi:hypothetical protein M8818_003884 [Zalaria obscura]|uniref:Uncharacterized protein n=1 Tax=Zalaria obscura TaxID=2024903 RepID=A0ACC3SDN9_9PEZI